MARVNFNRDFDWKPTWHSTIAYKADQEYTVRRECADAAVAAGAGREVDAPGKADDGAAE